MHGISSTYSKLLNIYSPDFPDFLLPFLESTTLQRLKDVSQSCGTEYCKYYSYKHTPSRFEHSLGVACIIRNFTKSKKQTLAGLFHDISHTVFSHVGDFLLGDAINQESSEQYTRKLLQSDTTVINELEKLNISLDEIDDYTKYSIADNKSPQLSADRLEYTLAYIHCLWREDMQIIKEIYNDICILEDENGNKELGFKSLKYAELCGYWSIKNCEGCYSSYESVSAMAFLGEIFRQAIKDKLIKHYDLYILKEQEFVALLESGKSKKSQEMRKFYKHLSTYKISRYEPKTEKYVVSSISKRRFIDPLINTKDGTVRLSKLSETFVQKRDYHINRKEEWIILDYTP